VIEGGCDVTGLAGWCERRRRSDRTGGGYWNHPDSSPEQIILVIVRALAAIAIAQRT